MAEPEELKVFLSKDNRPLVVSFWSPMLAAIVPAIVAAAVTYWAATLAYDSDLRDIDAKKELALSEIERAQDAIRLSALRDEFSGEKFRAQGNHIKWIATTEEIEKALIFESIVRNGATILALEELSRDVAKWREPIDAALVGVQRVLLVDSTFFRSLTDSKIYCTESIGTGRTNADDIVELVKHLPVRFAARKLEPMTGATDLAPEEESQIDDLLSLIETGKPNLIVIHEDAFAEFGTAAIGASTLEEVIDLVLSTNLDASAIIYSRGGVSTQLLANLRKTHGVQRPVSGVAMGLTKDVGDDCISAGSHNGNLIEEAITKALGHGNLYSHDWGLLEKK